MMIPSKLRIVFPIILIILFSVLTPLSAAASTEVIIPVSNWDRAVKVFLFTLEALLLFIIGYRALMTMMPFNLDRDLGENKNLAVAIFLSSAIISLALIVSWTVNTIVQ